MRTNDERVLELKKLVDEKKKLVSRMRFSPITNCFLKFDGQEYNLNVLTKEQLQHLFIKLRLFIKEVKECGIELTYGGFSINDWKEDVSNKLQSLSGKEEERKLAELESKLEKLLSADKQTELLLDKLEADLK